MPIIGAFMGGETSTIAAGSGVLDLNWITTTGLNMDGVTFSIVGPKTYSATSDSNGHAEITVDAGTYAVSVTHNGDYFGDDPKTIVVESMQRCVLTWVASKASAQTVTFTTPVAFSGASYQILSGETIMQSGSSWPTSIAFTLYPMDYKLKLTVYGHTLEYPFTVGAEGASYDLSGKLTKIVPSMSSYVGGVSMSLDGYSVNMYSDIYVIRDNSNYSISISAPNYKSGYPIVTLSSSGSITANAATVTYPITVTGVLTLFTASETVHIAKGKYRVVAVGGGGGGGINHGGGGGGYITDSTLSIDDSDVPVTIGSRGDVNNSGGATSLGSLVAASGGATAGTSSGNGGSGGSGGGGGVFSYTIGSKGYYKGGTGGRGYFGGGGGGGAQSAYSTDIGRGYGGGGGSKGGDGGTGGHYLPSSKESVGASAGSPGTNAPNSDKFFYNSGGCSGGSVSGASNAPHTGGGGGGGYSAKGGDGGKSMSTGTVFQIGGGGGGGGAMGGNGGSGKIANGAYADSGLGYGGGGGGIATYTSEYHGGGGGGGGYGTTPSSNTSGRGNPGCIRIQYVGTYE